MRRDRGGIGRGVCGGIGGTDRGATAPIGVILLIGITLLGTLTVVTLGSAAITDTQTTADIQRGEHVMTEFASTASMAALGETGTQSMSTGGGEGTMTVDEDAGRMHVWHLNASGDGNAEELTDGTSTLGAVTYRNGERTVAFQGGGVWRLDDGSPARMVSPPQFHYRGATLTLPIVSVNAGETVASGGPSRVRLSASGSTRVFPAPADPDSRNPVTNGSVVAVVESEYHEGWREYFERRTTGSVVEPSDVPAEMTADVDTDTAVILELEAVSGGGVFEWPGDGGSIPIRGLAGADALADFSTEVAIENPNNAWVSFHGRNGDRTVEAFLDFDSGQGKSTPVCEATFDAHVLYGDGETTHHWVRTDANGTQSGNEFTDCSADDDLIVDFTSTEPFTYTTAAAPDDTVYEWGSVNESATIVNTDGDNVTKSDGETLDVEEFIGYYVGELGPTFELEVEYATGGNGEGNQLEGDSSSLTFAYEADGSGQYITYLHITENEVTVEFS
ncbi:hypothetical protein [Halopenitus sp. POP-27]|uniref:DUF7289 family protein n=1 Tax=Halopenitus sp. POP-27 TaxID=2994425 RepID=UPI0024699742|nr:hypothetical protein [Halopenitus sp. POP-27]